MNNLLESGSIISGKIYMVELEQSKPKTLRVLAETPTHVIFVTEDTDGCEVFEQSKQQQIKGIYEIKDWYESNEA